MLFCDIQIIHYLNRFVFWKHIVNYKWPCWEILHVRIVVVHTSGGGGGNNNNNNTFSFLNDNDNNNFLFSLFHQI